MKWPTGPVSKAQWRYMFAMKRKGVPWAVKWAHTIAERGERLGPKAHYRSLPWRKRGPTATTLKKGR